MSEWHCFDTIQSEVAAASFFVDVSSSVFVVTREREKRAQRVTESESERKSEQAKRNETKKEIEI